MPHSWRRQCVSNRRYHVGDLFCVVFTGSGGQKGWHVFYHFVGAVPGSTELLGLLSRLLYEMKALPVRLTFLSDCKQASK